MLWIQQHKGVNAENMSSSQTQIWTLRAISFTAPVPSDINYTMSLPVGFLMAFKCNQPSYDCIINSISIKTERTERQNRGRGSS